jgi:AcrR family transcriptional regulator
MTATTTKRMGRPPKVTRQEILDAAARWEPAELQLTTLADALGISVKTVYYYFPARQALLDALTERAVAEMGLPDVMAAQSWRDVLAAAAAWYYRLGMEQPGWFAETNVSTRRVGLELLRLTFARLGELGWTKDQVFRAHMVVSNWAVCRGESAHANPFAEYSTDQLRGMLADYLAPDAAHELSAVRQPFGSDADVFDDGLAIVLAGIEQVILGGGSEGASPRR